MVVYETGKSGEYTGFLGGLRSGRGAVSSLWFSGFRGWTFAQQREQMEPAPPPAHTCLPLRHPEALHEDLQPEHRHHACESRDSSGQAPKRRGSVVATPEMSWQWVPLAPV